MPEHTESNRNNSGMRAMIFAAGLGSRLKPWTDHHPKALALINGKPLLQRNVEYLQQYGIRNVIVNVHHFADQVIDALRTNNGWGSSVTISDETDEVLETGGGLKKASAWLGQSDNFVVMNADILTDLDLGAMIQQHCGAPCVATLAVSRRETSRYFLFNEAGELCGWRNVKTGEEKISRPSVSLVEMAFSGVHVISREMLPLISRNGKFSMVDVYLDIAKDYIIRAFDHTGTKLVDVGKPESIPKAEALFP